MTKYFYSNGNNKIGPVLLESFKTETILENTLVWREGLDNWVEAKELP